MKNFDDDIIDMANAALAAQRAGQTDEATTVTMPHRMFIRLITQAQEFQHGAMQYQAYHETEKTMRQFAEHDLGKFRKIIGRLFWQVRDGKKETQ